MLHHDIWLLWTFLQPQILTFFLKSVFKFAEKSDDERINLITLVIFMKVDNIC